MRVDLFEALTQFVPSTAIGHDGAELGVMDVLRKLVHVIADER
jgi:hypothetical protein